MSGSTVPTDPDRGSSSALVVGVLAWALQPLYVVAELVAAAASTAPYSLAANTISDLGAVTCTEIGYPYGPVPVCSPLHPLVNGSFILFGLLMILGAVLLRGRFGRRGWARAAVVAFVVAGLGSLGTGLTPLDQALELHVLVSSPTFVAQPVALLAVGLALRGRHRALSVTSLLAGAITLLAAVAFFATSGTAGWGGLLERLALWPAYGWLAGFALAVLRGRVGASPVGAGRVTSGPAR